MKLRALTIAVLGALCARASAQPSAERAERAAKTFAENLNAYEARIHAHFERARPKFADSVGTQLNDRTVEVEADLDEVNATPDIAPLGPANAATAADRIAAALSTNVEGAEAGITIAPAKLAGDEYSVLSGATLTIASLEGGGARGGVGWTHAWKPRLELRDLDLPPCDEQPALTAARALREPYTKICEGIPLEQFPIGEPAKALQLQQAEWVGVALACGRDDLIKAAGNDAKALAEELRTSGDQLYVRSRDLVTAATGNDALDEYRMTLDEWRKKPFSRTSCFNDEQGKKVVEAAVARAIWNRPRTKVGVALTADLFPLIYGFRPDPDVALSRGELHKAQLHLEYEYTLGRSTLTLGVGGGYARAKPVGDFGRTLAPNIGLRVVLARLDGHSIDELVPNKDTPTLSFGVTARGERTLDKEEMQESNWNEVEVTAFADFKISEELAFRVGVPIKAELATREADDDAMPPIVEKKGLQWTLPVFVATVLKL